MPKITLAIAVFSLLLFACKTSKEQTAVEEQSSPVQAETPEEAELQKQILGEWVWDRTSCCYRRPVITTSDTLNYDLILKFNPDGRLQYFHDDELQKTLPYEVGIGLMNDSRPILTIDEKQPALLYISNDTLIIDYGYIDLQTEFYLRKPN